MATGLRKRGPRDRRPPEDAGGDAAAKEGSALTVPWPRLLVGGACLFLTIVWAVLAESGWRALRSGRHRGPISRLHPFLTSGVALAYFTGAVASLLPPLLPDDSRLGVYYLYLVNDVAGAMAAAVFRHMAWHLLHGRETPSRRWLTLHYGLLAAVAIFALGYPLAGGRPSEEPWALHGSVVWTYFLVMLATSLGMLSRVPQGGPWRAGDLHLRVASPLDRLLLGAGLVILGLVSLLFVSGGWARSQLLVGALMVAFGAIVLLPFAVRDLGEAIHGTLRFLGMLAATAVAVVVSFGIAFELGAADEPLVIAALIAGGLLLVLGPFQAWLAIALDLVVFRRRHRRREELYGLLHTLAPGAGLQASCERALDALCSVMQFDGAAIVFRDGGVAQVRDIAASELERSWPRGEEADRLTRRTLLGGELGELPPRLARARRTAGVIGLWRVEGANRLWGHLLVRADLVAASLTEEDAQTIEGFCDQLGLLLDETALLARAIAVERSLVHAEKLAVIGEFAARVVHEIRNPVAAARSLAQQLAGDLERAEDSVAARVILEELDRVDRQVADLLRLARRDELRLEAIELGELVRSTVGRFADRLRSCSLEVVQASREPVHARADREQVRQVLVNLIENAIDAMAAHPGTRRLHLEVGRANGCAQLKVADTGPGVHPSDLERIFEPFWSSKPSGTGLGLAIVKRTIEAHGGRIAASAAPVGTGLQFRIELPLASAETPP
jgi:signal transduction histidine kinase